MKRVLLNNNLLAIHNVDARNELAIYAETTNCVNLVVGSCVYSYIVDACFLANAVSECKAGSASPFSFKK